MRFLPLLALLLAFATPAHAQLKYGRVVSSCGAPTLTAGSVDQVTQDVNGRLCMGEVSFGSTCQAAVNYLARTTGGNEGGNALAIQNLICGLVSDGVITGNLSGATGCGTYLDGLYILAQQNAADAKLNLCGTSYSLTANAATVFRSYIGFNNFPTGLDTGFNTATAPGAKWTLNNAGFGVWAYSSVANTIAVAGTLGGVKTNMYINYNGAQMWLTVNGGSAGSIAAPGSRGSAVGERISAANIRFFLNGTPITSIGSTSNGLDSANMIFGNITGAADSGAALSEAHMGAMLGDPLELALYNRLRAYMTAIGVP